MTDFIRERALEDRRTYIHAQCLLLSNIIDNFQKDLHELVEKENEVERQLETIRNKIAKQLAEEE